MDINQVMKSMVVSVASVAMLGGCSSTINEVYNSSVDALTAINGETAEEQELSPEEKEKKRNKTVGGLSAGLGLLTAGLCANNAKNRQYEGNLAQQAKERMKREAICYAAGLATGYLTNLLGKEITKHLKEEEQKQVIVAAQKTLQTGEPAFLEFPESNTSVTVSLDGEAFTTESEVDLVLETAFANTSSFDELAIIASSYVSNTDKQLDTFKTTKGTEVYIIGEKGDQYLVGVKAIPGGDYEYPEPVGIGYVNKTEFDSKGRSFEELEPVNFDSNAVTVTTMATLNCGSLTFDLKTEESDTAESTANSSCLLPDGTILQI